MSSLEAKKREFRTKLRQLLIENLTATQRNGRNANNRPGLDPVHSTQSASHQQNVEPTPGQVNSLWHLLEHHLSQRLASESRLFYEKQINDLKNQEQLNTLHSENAAKNESRLLQEERDTLKFSVKEIDIVRKELRKAENEFFKYQAVERDRQKKLKENVAAREVQVRQAEVAFDAKVNEKVESIIAERLGTKEAELRIKELAMRERYSQMENTTAMKAALGIELGLKADAIADLENKLIQSNKQIDSLTDRLDRRLSNDPSKDEIISLKRLLEGERKIHESELVAARNQIAQLSRQLNDAPDQIEHLRQSVGRYSLEGKSAKEKYEVEKSEFQKLLSLEKKRSSDLETKNQQLESRCEHLKEDVVRLEVKLSYAEGQSVFKRHRYHGTSAVLDRSTTTSESTPPPDYVRDARRRLGGLEDEIARFESQLEAYNAGKLTHSPLKVLSGPLPVQFGDTPPTPGSAPRQPTRLLNPLSTSTPLKGGQLLNGGRPRNLLQSTHERSVSDDDKLKDVSVSDDLAVPVPSEPPAPEQPAPSSTIDPVMQRYMDMIQRERASKDAPDTTPSAANVTQQPTVPPEDDVVDVVPEKLAPEHSGSSDFDW